MVNINGYELDIVSFIPAVAAVGLSIWNWLQYRRGAVLNPLPIINYALWGNVYQDRKSKVLIFPIIIQNNGTQLAIVTGISVQMIHQGVTHDLEVRRKVDLVELSPESIRNMSRTMFLGKGLIQKNPFYPIFVPAFEGTTPFIECYDSDAGIPLDATVTCKITLEYDGTKQASCEFPFVLSAENFDKSTSELVWLKP